MSDTLAMMNDDAAGPSPSSSSKPVTILSDVRNFLTRPFVGQMDIVHLFLAVGLVIVFIGLWSLILFHIRAAAQEIS
jgi:hypothetical protein